MFIIRVHTGKFEKKAVIRLISKGSDQTASMQWHAVWIHISWLLQGKWVQQDKRGLFKLYLEEPSGSGVD